MLNSGRKIVKVASLLTIWKHLLYYFCNVIELVLLRQIYSDVRN